MSLATLHHLFLAAMIWPLELVTAAQSLEGLPEQVCKADDNYAWLIAQKFPSLMSEKLGCFPGFEHSITLMENAKLTT